jgi:hypothetical protein
MLTLNDAVSGNNWPPVFPTHISICPSTDAAPFRVPLRPAPPRPVAVPRRQRQRSLASTLRAARKAGADHAMVDGVKIVLSPAADAPAESNGNEFDQWKAKHAR